MMVCFPNHLVDAVYKKEHMKRLGTNWEHKSKNIMMVSSGFVSSSRTATSGSQRWSRQEMAAPGHLQPPACTNTCQDINSTV